MALGLDLGYLERSARGEFDLGWLRDTNTEWGVRAVPSKTGLTMRDIAIGSYGVIPDTPPLRTMAPRGADVESDVPDMGYTINDRAEVWPDNVLDLYEEAVSRQWSATRDIPWADLVAAGPRCRARHVPAGHRAVRGGDGGRRLPGQVAVADQPRLRRSQDVPLHPGDGRGPPHRGVPQAGPGQRGRPGQGDGGGRAVPAAHPRRRVLRRGSALMHLLGEGIVLSLFRAGAALSPRPPSSSRSSACACRTRPATWPTARCTCATGWPHDPSMAEDFHAYLDQGEEIIAMIFATPEIVEPTAILAAGSVEAACAARAAAGDVLRLPDRRRLPEAVRRTPGSTGAAASTCPTP